MFVVLFFNFYIAIYFLFIIKFDIQILLLYLFMFSLLIYVHFSASNFTLLIRQHF